VRRADHDQDSGEQAATDRNQPASERPLLSSSRRSSRSRPRPGPNQCPFHLPTSKPAAPAPLFPARADADVLERLGITVTCLIRTLA
jgi:hypothetical protein